MHVRWGRLLAVSVVTTVALGLAVAASLWSVWASAPYLTPYFLLASALPFATALVFGRRELLAPTFLFVVGVATVFIGVIGDGIICVQPRYPTATWSPVYDVSEQVIRFVRYGEGGEYACTSRPIPSVVVLGTAIASLAVYEVSVGSTRRGPIESVRRRTFEAVRSRGD